MRLEHSHPAGRLWFSAVVFALGFSLAHPAASAETPVPLHQPPISLEFDRPAPRSDWIIRAGLLIDGKGGRAVRDMEILVVDGRVKRIAESIPAAADARILDLTGYTVLPGFIDCHTHLTMRLEPGWETQAVRESEADEALKGVEAARVTLEAGFTTVRNVGARSMAGIALKKAIDAGRVPGPRMIDAGKTISILGGHGDSNNFAAGILEDDPSWKRGIVAGPDDCRAAVRYAIKHGAGVIKITSTGGVLSQGDAVTSRQFSDEELRVIVEEAGFAHRKVASHAHGAEGIKAAVRAGVASIEHGTYLDAEAIRLMKKHHCYLVPTRMAGEAVLEAAAAGKLPEWAMEKTYEVAPLMRKSFAAAVRAGVPIAFGTDAGVFPHGLNAREFQLMVEGGMTPMNAILSATREAARLLGRDDVGVLEPGRWADLVVVKGDPLEDITLLQDPSLVMKGGRIVFDRRSAGLTTR